MKNSSKLKAVFFFEESERRNIIVTPNTSKLINCVLNSYCRPVKTVKSALLLIAVEILQNLTVIDFIHLFASGGQVKYRLLLRVPDTNENTLSNHCFVTHCILVSIVCCLLFLLFYVICVQNTE